MSKICTLCSELKGDLQLNLFYHLFHGEPPHRILRETPGFVVMPTIGPLVRGHLLVVSKQHFLSTAHLPQAMYRELEELLEETCLLMTRRICAPLFFEHGPVAEDRTGGACIEHAHIHAVPVSLDVREDLTKSFAERRIEKLSELSIQVARGMPYLYYQDTTGNRYAYDIPEPIPSQFMRRCIGSKLSVQNRWNWNLYPEKQSLLETLELFADWSPHENGKAGPR